jgi:cbb3-type cytochrome oxidase subunit 3
MSNDENKPESTQSWVTGLTVVVAVIVSYIGFARISVEWTLVIATLVFLGLVAFLWRAGARKQGSGRRGR